MTSPASVVAAPRKIVFSNPDRSFRDDVNRRVEAWFAERGISPRADGRIAFKVVFYMGALVALWSALVLAGPPAWLALPLCVLIGMTFAGIGFNIGHDAIHGASSDKTWVNKLMSMSFDLMGASSTTWSVAHNFVHHTYTNIPGVDHDLEPGPWMIFKPTPRPPAIYRFQHIHAWFFYGFTTIVWLVKKDFEQIFAPDPRTGKRAPFTDVLKVFAGKLSHVTLVIALPLLLVDRPWWQIVIGIFVAHFAAGVTLAMVFQLAHCVEGTAFPAPADGKVADEWAAHQMRTTSNFGSSHPILGFLVGGLDHQVEHHLFPKVAHVHYPALSPIVRQCAADHGLPYLENRTFLGALASHVRTMKRFGRPQQSEPAHGAAPPLPVGRPVVAA